MKIRLLLHKPHAYALDALQQAIQEMARETGMADLVPLTERVQPQAIEATPIPGNAELSFHDRVSLLPDYVDFLREAILRVPDLLSNWDQRIEQPFQDKILVFLDANLPEVEHGL